MRTAQLHIRLTPDEMQLFQLAAERDGISLSKWVIDHCKAAASPDKKRRKSSQTRASRFADWGDDNE